MPTPPRQYPNSYGRPDCTITASYTHGDGTLHIDECPLGVLQTGPLFTIKLGRTLIDVTDIGAYPHQDWSIDPGVENTQDVFDYPAGEPVYLEHTHDALEDIRNRSFITSVDETAHGYPNSRPVDSLRLSEFDSALHADLPDVDPNQHHPQFHNHTNDLDSTSLFPNILYAMQQFALNSSIAPPQITANQNDYQPDGGEEASVWKLTSDASRRITGIAYTEVEGFLHILKNKGSFDIVLGHNDSASAPNHRFLLPGAADYTIAPGHSVLTYYDIDDERIWILQ